MNNVEFFQKLYSFSEGFVELRSLPIRAQEFVGLNSDTFEVDLNRFCDKYKKNHIYFGVASKDGKSGKKENIVNIPAVWADIDFKDTQREILSEKLSRFPFKPSYIVKSGGGVHLYWQLKEPVEKSGIKTIEDVNKRIAEALGGDRNACDAARVLRVPDTENRKYNPPRPCVVAQVNDFYYSLDDFLEILPESNLKSTLKNEGITPNENGWLSDAMQGVGEGDRNAAATKIAGYWINKLPFHDVLTILSTWNKHNTPPLSQSEIETIAKSVSRYKPDIESKRKVDISNIYDPERMIQEYRRYIKNLKNNRFITGIPEIDKRIRGVAGGEVLTIIARSGSFKTATLQNLLKNYIQNSAWAAVFFSIEMPVASLTERYLAILNESTGKKVEDFFSDRSQPIIQEAAEKEFISDLKNLFVIPTKVSLSDIPAYIQLIEKEKNTKVGVVGIDYLGLMEGPGGGEYEIISRLATGLKSTAKLLNIPVIVLSQVSRKGGDGTLEISLDMGRGSGAIEEGADFVLGMWQVQEDDEISLICRILKNRKGPSGSRWRLDLNPAALKLGPDAERYILKDNNGGIHV